MKKVLVFGMTNNPGGMESVIMNYYRHIDRSKVQFEFLCNTETVAYSDEIEQMGGIIHKITARSVNPTKYKKDLKVFFEENSSKYCALWFNTCSLSNIDYLKYAKKYNIPKRIIHCHNAANGGDGLLRSILHKFHRRYLNKYVTDYWTCSEDANKWFFGKEGDKLINYRLIYNAIDLNHFAPNEKIRDQYRKKLGIKPNEILVGHDGRLHYQKNQEYLIRVFEKLNRKFPGKYKLLLIGKGDDEEKLRGLVNEKNLNNEIIFQGLVNNMNDYLQAMDIFAFPSRFEGLSIALLEAQANGLPCVISNKISNASKVNENVVMLPIDDDAIDLWVNQIDIYSNVGKKVDIEQFEAKHFDINNEAKVLQELF